MTAEQYARQLKQLLPRGKAWEVEPGSIREKVLLAISDELARVDARAVNLQDEWDPRTTTELLDDWERVLGLPDDCLTDPGAVTTAERRAAIEQKLTSRGGQTPQFYIDIAAALGVTVTITEYPQANAFRAGGFCGELVYSPAWAFAWKVNAPPGTAASVRTVLECAIRRARPAHTTVFFTYS